MNYAEEDKNLYLEVPRTKETQAQKLKENMKEGKAQFLNKGVAMAIQGIIDLRVQCACKVSENILSQKRTRLRELLLAEEVAYTTEYVALCQQANVNRKEQLKKQALEIRTQSERERKQYADQKLFEWKLHSCDDLRTAFNRQKSMELKKDHLWQIKEKYSQLEAKREEDRMYHDCMIKNMMSLAKVEEENARVLWLKRQNDKEAYLEQLKWKEEKKEQEKLVKEFEKQQILEHIRLAKEAEEKELSKKNLLRSQITADVQETLRIERETKKKRRIEEEELDRTFAELLKIQAEKEKIVEVSNKERIKREMDIFLEKSRELKLKRLEEEKKLDLLLEELNEKKRLQKEEERKKLKAARKELFCDVLRTREKQVIVKQEMEKRREEEKQKEIELLYLQIEHQQKLRDEYERRCEEQKEAYRCQLLEQIQEVQEARKMKKADEIKYDKLLIEQQQREIEEIKAMVKSMPVSGQDHPMKVIFKDQPPKYVCPFPCPR